MSNWVEEFRKGKFVISCITENEANELMKILQDNNFKWINGSMKFTENRYSDYREKTYYTHKNGSLQYGNLDRIDRNDVVMHFSKINKKENKPMKKEVDLGIKQVIYNPPATILVHNDGTKTVVKTTNNDEYDPIFGYLMAYFQKHSGLSKTQVGKLCDKIVEDFSKQQEKKNKNVVKDGFNEEYCC